MRKTVIILGGEEYGGDIDFTDAFVISCDRGLEYLKSRDIRPDVVMGDFDSLGYVPENSLVFPIEKDFTDFELALDYCKEHDLDNIEAYCGGGGREDHLMANYGLLLSAHKAGKRICFFTDYTKSFIAEGRMNISLQSKNTTFSLVPLYGKVTVGNGKGTKYPLDGVNLSMDKSLGISNIALEKEISFETDEPCLFMEVLSELRH